MNTLHCFGDSFTQGHYGDMVNYPPYQEFKKYRGGELFETWSEILSKKLNYILENKGHSGCSNEEIFSIICNNVCNFQKGDIVIINWTFITRFRWIHSNGLWETVHGGPASKITEKTRKEILKNRFSPLYAELIYEYEKIIDRLAISVGFQVYYWSAENNLIYCLPNKNQKKYIISELINSGETIFYEIFRRGGKTIQHESNFTIEDIHLGESGHKIQAELFYNYIMGIPEKPFDYIELDPKLYETHLSPEYDPVKVHSWQLNDSI